LIATLKTVVGVFSAVRIFWPTSSPIDYELLLDPWLPDL
jgi:hypothetical protein